MMEREKKGEKGEDVGNLTEIPTCEKQKIEKTHAKEKQSHAQDIIYVIR